MIETDPMIGCAQSHAIRNRLPASGTSNCAPYDRCVALQVHSDAHILSVSFHDLTQLHNVPSYIAYVMNKSMFGIPYMAFYWNIFLKAFLEVVHSLIRCILAVVKRCITIVGVRASIAQVSAQLGIVVHGVYT